MTPNPSFKVTPTDLTLGKFQMVISPQGVIRSTSWCLVLGWDFLGRWIVWRYFAVGPNSIVIGMWEKIMREDRVIRLVTMWSISCSHKFSGKNFLPPKLTELLLLSKICCTERADCHDKSSVCPSVCQTKQTTACLHNACSVLIEVYSGIARFRCDNTSFCSLYVFRE